MPNEIIDQDEMPPELPMSEPARLAGVYFSRQGIRRYRG